ncbi:type VI secretion system baseplate subunit TssF [Paraburkholderia sp. SOS3]|uniref:type VI secretion system baseplate subunit TssF n=1 Tax=Paraburkholderia sp. SOS3 TaxID=1926494 RepID=UPI00094764DC|nr:type VI secretion system baseplate subunit TssF [Paraburkholderia sp. SOS3]APR35854.1 type VI secretion protein [Paraburkholderia sp. SOS3]
MSDDPDFLKYFDAEMRYLREASAEFAAAHPQAARRLGLLTPGARHDSVDQLYQAFAFLTARLHAKLDDALPEITDPLLGNLWPHTARTIPSLAILECVPRAGEARLLGTLPAGLAVHSSPVGPDRVVCRYRTTQSVDLLPLDVCEARVAVRADGRTVIRLAFDLRHAEQRQIDDLSRIRLYLHGDRATASALYAALTRQVSAIGVRMPLIRDGQLLSQPGLKFERSGFGPSSRLSPVDETQAKAGQNFDREQTMLEYFAFPEKFHFVDLCGFDAASVPVSETRIEFEIELAGSLCADVQIDSTNIRLFCTPLINLFETDAEPLRPRDIHDREHRLRVQGDDSDNAQAYDVVSVTATDPVNSRRHEYCAFKAFRHRGGMMRFDAPERYFHTATRAGLTSDRQLSVTLGGQSWEPGASSGPAPDQHIAVRVLANNGRLPRMALADSTITEPASDFPGIDRVRNLTAPTMPLYAPRQRSRYDWRVIAHFSGGGCAELNMLDERVLRGALALYDWTELPDNAQRIAAIERAWVTADNFVDYRSAVRDVRIHVAIDAAKFAGAGDVALFGDVLSHFVGRYASFNYSVRLVLIADGKETVYARNDFDGAPF